MYKTQAPCCMGETDRNTHAAADGSATTRSCMRGAYCTTNALVCANLFPCCLGDIPDTM